MADNKIRIDEQVVEQLTHVADSMTTMLEKLMETQRGQSTDLDYFKLDLKQVRDSIKSIAKVLHEGNGEKPLLARVAIIEVQIADLVSDVAKLQTHEEDNLKRMLDQADEARSNKEEQEKIGRKGKYALAVAVVSGLGGLATALISALT